MMPADEKEANVFLLNRITYIRQIYTHGLYISIKRSHAAGVTMQLHGPSKPPNPLHGCGRHHTRQPTATSISRGAAPHAGASQHVRHAGPSGGSVAACVGSPRLDWSTRLAGRPQPTQRRRPRARSLASPARLCLPPRRISFSSSPAPLGVRRKEADPSPPPASRDLERVKAKQRRRKAKARRAGTREREAGKKSCGAKQRGNREGEPRAGDSPRPASLPPPHAFCLHCPTRPHLDTALLPPPSPLRLAGEGAL
ncbi:hypothetical protein BS78_04G056600 [Paspalum vaginatum]|nr:hypothetical protein BS78_04G056600 [Paspalum vaginatum]